MPEETKSLILPETDTVKRELQAINNFQEIVHSALKKDLDYGVIPGTKRPTLLKPGAEKITKLLGLCDTYEIIQQIENWDKPFFYYQVRCNLTTASGLLVCQGLGSCNSMEVKYRYRWLWPDDAEKMPGFKKEGWPKKTVKTKSGKTNQYRFENDEIFSQVNTLLKMGKKRSLIDAALSAGRLSELFTQDVEDMQGVITADYEVMDEDSPETPREKEHFCTIHNVPFKRHEKEGEVWYSHKIEGTEKYCTEPKPAQTTTAAPPPPAPPPAPPLAPPAAQLLSTDPAPPASSPVSEEDEKNYHFKWLHKALKTLGWGELSMANYIDNMYHIGRGLPLEDAVRKLKPDQLKAFYKSINDNLPK